MADPAGRNGGGTGEGIDTTAPDTHVPAATMPVRRRSRENLGALIGPPAARAIAAPTDRVGALISGRYQIVRFIASGGMGDVYQAQDRFMNEAIALKVLQPEIASDESSLARFRQEAQLARRITHASVCRIFDISLGHDDAGRSLAFMTMELLDGETLSARVRKLGKMPAPMALSIAEQLASALDAAHALGIIHRDFKTANVLIVDQPNNAKRAVVMDFGIATLTDDPTRLDPTGARLGTVGYMAPEQLRGDVPTPAIDIYAFGVVLHEMRTGRLPGPPIDQAQVAGRRSTFDRVTDRPLQTLEPNWDLAIRRCLEEDPAARWPTAAAAVSCLRSETRSPYRGLVPFQADDRALFFGRDREQAEILERLRVSGFVLVAGTPGSGKSSICRAGVVPDVIAGALGGPRTWRIAEVVPGRSPATAVRDVIATIRRFGSAALGHSITSDLRSVPTPESGLLLFLDQLEELVTMSQPAEAVELARTIGRVTSAPEPGLRILATARTDLLGELATFEGIRQAIPRALYFLPTLSDDGLRDAIVEPANHHGVRFEPPDLVERLIEAAGTPPNLPLLQFVLSELWKQRDVTAGTITPKALEAIGGMDGALTRHAERVLSELMPPQRPIAREILGALVTQTGRLARRSAGELNAAEPERRAVLDQLLRSNIVVVHERDDEVVYELAHESLVRQWSAVRQLVESGAASTTLDPDAGASYSQRMRALAKTPAPAPEPARTRNGWKIAAVALALVATAAVAYLVGSGL
ncbi:MAG TPA: serine/threonine-protein kinase [Kofleriaceae bacterium]|nr:serine/threonine-protein kinase [Kofleriaceae bacterium]